MGNATSPLRVLRGAHERSVPAGGACFVRGIRRKGDEAKPSPGLRAYGTNRVAAIRSSRNSPVPRPPQSADASVRRIYTGVPTRPAQAIVLQLMWLAARGLRYRTRVPGRGAARVPECRHAPSGSPPITPTARQTFASPELDARRGPCCTRRIDQTWFGAATWIQVVPSLPMGFAMADAALPLNAGHLSILHVVAPAEVGGLERVVHALAVGHAGRGHRVGAVVSLGPGNGEHPFLPPLRAAGVDVVALDLPSRAYRAERRALADAISRFAPDLIHTHGYRPDVVALGPARRAGVPTLTTVHGFTGGGWKNRIYEGAQRLAFHRHGTVVAVSVPLEQGLRRWGLRPPRLQRIANAWGGDGEHDRSGAQARLGVAADGPWVLGWVGRMTREKGADVLVDALTYLTDVPLEAHLIGDGRERAKLQASVGAHPPIKWHGRVFDAGALFAAFDVFVLSSRTEGTPIVLFEAMQHGVPIVATRVGGVPDVVSPGEAMLVPPEDPEALAAAIRAVYDDPAAARARAAAAQERLRSQFGLQPWLEAYETLYRRLAAERRTLPNP